MEQFKILKICNPDNATGNQYSEGKKKKKLHCMSSKGVTCHLTE